jgi:hypothetical protein
MSNTITGPTTIEELEHKYNKMIQAYDLFEAEDDPEKKASFKLYYQTQLNIYRDTCSIVVEHLMQINPTALNEVKL